MQVREPGGAKGTWERYMPSSKSMEPRHIKRAHIHKGLRHMRLSRGAMADLGNPARVALFFDVEGRRIGIAAAENKEEGSLKVRSNTFAVHGLARQYGLLAEDAGAYDLTLEGNLLVLSLGNLAPASPLQRT